MNTCVNMPSVIVMNRTTITIWLRYSSSGANNEFQRPFGGMGKTLLSTVAVFIGTEFCNLEIYFSCCNKVIKMLCFSTKTFLRT